MVQTGGSWSYWMSATCILQLIQSPTTIVRVSGQGWSDHLFASSAPPPRRETVPCPEGASRQLGDRHSRCRCGFGYGGGLEWEPLKGAYFGECKRTPCPQNAKPGKYAGTCECEAPFRGFLEWASHPAPHYIGECKRAPCPDFSHVTSSVEEIEMKMPNGQELTMEENSQGMLKSTLELLYMKAIHWKPVLVEEKEPRCACNDGYSGGFMWDYGSRSFFGGCISKHPCPAGQTGANPATWITAPWKLEHGIQSSRAKPREDGDCRPAPCPAHSSLDSSTGHCKCSRNFPGTLRWNLTAEAYEGWCKAKFPCPGNAVHREFPISTTRSRLGCACKDGFLGSWGAKGRGWPISCHHAKCPEGASWHQDHPCKCREGQEGVHWSRATKKYIGHCRRSTIQTTRGTLPTTTVSAISATHGAKGAEASGEHSSTSLEESKINPEHRSVTPKMLTTSERFLPSTTTALPPTSTALRSSTTQDKVTGTELYVGYGEFILAGIMSVIGIIKAIAQNSTSAPQQDTEKKLMHEDSSKKASSPRSSGSSEHSDDE